MKAAHALALILAGVSLPALAADRGDHPRRGDDFFTSQPADGGKNLQGGWPYIPGEYSPPPRTNPAQANQGAALALMRTWP